MSLVLRQIRWSRAHSGSLQKLGSGRGNVSILRRGEHNTRLTPSPGQSPRAVGYLSRDEPDAQHRQRLEPQFVVGSSLPSGQASETSMSQALCKVHFENTTLMAKFINETASVWFLCDRCWLKQLHDHSPNIKYSTGQPDTSGTARSR